MVFIPVATGSAIVGVSAYLLIRRARGKRLAILGPRRAGKTTLATFLQKGEIPAGYKPTTIRTTTKARRRMPGTKRLLRSIKMKDVELKLTMLDNPGVTPLGEKQNYGIWQESAKKVQVILYLVDVSKLSERRYRNVAINGVQHIARWGLSDRRKVLILTHTDLDPAWESGAPDAIADRAAVKDLRRELKPEGVIMGSLKDVAGTRDVAYQLLEFLAR